MTIKFIDKSEFILGGGDWELAPFKFSKILKIGGGTEPSYIDIIISGTTSVTLTNAISLNYLKLFGGTEQRNLPEEYTQLEYIESDGTQYIDTGLKLNQNNIVEVRYCYYTESSVSTSGRVFGARYTSGSRNSFSIGSNTGKASADTVVFGQFGDNSAVALNNIVIGQWNTYKLSADGFYINEVKQDDLPVATFETPFTVKLFAFEQASSSDATPSIGCGIGRCKQFKVWNGDTLVMDLISAKNTSNVVGMYDTVSGQFFTNQGTGSFVAGAEAVPSPDTPIDIVSNNGVIKFNANLLDANTITTGYYIKDNGVITEQSYAFYSALIPVKPNTSYVFSRVGTSGQYIRIHGYDANGDWQEMLAKTDTTSDVYLVATTESNTSYVRISARVGTDMEFKLGDTYPTNIITYTDGTVETVKVTGKNLFDKNNRERIYGYFPNTGYAWTYNGSAYSDRIPCLPNTTYTARYNGNSSQVVLSFASTSSDSVPTADSQTVSVTNSIRQNSPTIDTPITITTGASDKWLIVAYNVAEPQNTDMADNLQIELGSTATTYTPYFNGGTATAEMLLKVGDYQDVQEVLSGDVTRYLGVKVLDGTEEGWAKTNNSFSNNTLFAVKKVEKSTVFCTHFQYDTGSTTAIPDMCVGCATTTTNTYFRYDALSTIEQWKQWLSDQYNAGTPVIVVYPLATATTETVTGQHLTVQNGTNIVEITQASIDGLSLEVSYKQQQ